MQFDKEIAVKVQKYFKEVNGVDYTVQEILKWPRWERVWNFWKYLERYEGKGPPDLSLDACKKIYGDDHF